MLQGWHGALLLQGWHGALLLQGLYKTETTTWLASLRTGGTAYIRQAIERAVMQLSASRRSDTPAFIVLLTDTPQAAIIAAVD